MSAASPQQSFWRETHPDPKPLDRKLDARIGNKEISKFGIRYKPWLNSVDGTGNAEGRR